MAALSFACSGNRNGGDDSAVAERQDSTVVVPDTEAIDTLEQLITETPMPRAADELFDDFLFNFAANKQLQLERVAFPLPVIRNGKTTHTERNAWKTERFFMSQGYYTVLFDDEAQKAVINDTSVNRAILEKIYFNTGAVQQYLFSRIKGAWMLVGIKTEPIAANRNASFLKFYHQFVTDSLFQSQSLGTTVTFVGPDPDDDFARMEGILTAETWPAFAPKLPDRMIYNIVYGEQKKNKGTIVLMLRGIANGQELEMSFRMEGNHWKLQKLTT